MGADLPSGQFAGGAEGAGALLQSAHLCMQGQAEPSLSSLPAAFTPSGGIEDT